MKISSFVNALLPNIEKKMILEDLSTLVKELDQFTLQSYESVMDEFKGRKFQNRGAEFEEAFMRETRLPYRGNHVEQIGAVLRNLQTNLKLIERMVEKSFDEQMAKEAVSYYRAQMLQYISAATLVTRYARKHLLWLIMNEVREQRSDSVDYMSRPDLKYLQTNRRNFFDGLMVVAGNKRELEKAFDGIPTATVVEERVGVIEATVGVKKLDPFGLGMIPVVLNPIYHIGVAIAEWQASRYKAAQEELKALEYRLIQLKSIEEGKRDAKLEKLIEYTEDRVQKLNYKIAKMEEDYG